MHPTAIEAMRLYCVDARPFTTTPKSWWECPPATTHIAGLASPLEQKGKLGALPSLSDICNFCQKGLAKRQTAGGQ